jgi:hypothetical protein
MQPALPQAINSDGSLQKGRLDDRGRELERRGPCGSNAPRRRASTADSKWTFFMGNFCVWRLGNG